MRFGEKLSPTAKYWIFLFGIMVAIFAVIFGSFIASYLNLPPADQELARGLFDKLLAFPFIGAILLIVIISTLVSLIFKSYIIPVLKMAEQTRLITTVNPDHRITTNGARELVELADIINESAEAYQKLQNEVEQKIADTNQALQEETNRFAALMSELPNGVIVCNSDGTILLYNHQAQELLNPENGDDDMALGGTIGLGRSIFGTFDRGPIVHALEVMNHDHGQGQVKPALGLMTKLCKQRFIRINMAPVTQQGETRGEISGFVLTLEDMTGEIAVENERDRQLQALIDAVQKSLGRIHSGLASICAMPGVGGDACDLHRKAIGKITTELEAHLALARELYSQHRIAYGNRENVLSETLLAILAKSLSERFGLTVELTPGQAYWLTIDSYSIVQAIASLAGLLKAEFDIENLHLSIDAGHDNLANLTVAWRPHQVPAEALENWYRSPLFMDSQGQQDSPQTIFSRHGGALRTASDTTNGCRHTVISLPLAMAGTEDSQQNGSEPRPISYEFDLFHQPGQQALADVPLTKLTYVAFDTETTGLNPSDGDEIIQIGAVRIVNGRMLVNEVIDQLVNPQRAVPPSSVKVHGIQAELLDRQPTIDKVLPHFHSFVKNTVLVAHNAAFDMRFLQLKEELTGLRFENPVLDTLLLSSLVHPNQEGHSLDDIAARLNIRVTGRHTALGDALVTAEVLLKLIPLLETRGIRTLADALTASEKSTFNRLKY